MLVALSVLAKLKQSTFTRLLRPLPRVLLLQLHHVSVFTATSLLQGRRYQFKVRVSLASYKTQCHSACLTILQADQISGNNL